MSNPEQGMLNNLRRKYNHLSDWLKRHKIADEFVGDVQRELRITEWQIDALDNRPNEAYEVTFPDIEKTFDSDAGAWEAALPQMPDYNRRHMIQASGFSASGTVSIYEYASRVGEIGTDDAQEYSNRVTVTLQDIYADQDRLSQLRNAINELGNPNLEARLDEAIQACNRYSAGTSTRESAGIHMRNLIDGLKGELFELARVRAGEKMDWDLMSERIARGAKGSPVHLELVSLDTRRLSLIERLSQIAKDREGGIATDVINTWTTLQVFLLAVLRLVDI